MPQISYKDIVKILKNNKCEYKREGKGSHEIWYSPITQKHFTVSKTIKADGTYFEILKQAGIKQ